MTTSRERVIKTLNREPVDRTPRELWTSAATESLHADEVAEMAVRYPNDVVPPEFRFPRGKLARGNPSEVGKHTDAWGCVWRVAKRGRPPELESSPLADSTVLDGFSPPLEIIEAARPDAMNRACAAGAQFVLARSETCPLDRLRMLRGSDAALADLTTSRKKIRGLIAMLHDFSCREMEFWASTDVDGVLFGDDWGTASGLVLPRRVWREVFRHMYQEYCRILHDGDKFAFFRSAGQIDDIFGDLVEMDVDAVQGQLSLMDVDKVAARYRTRITFSGEIVPASVLRESTAQDIRNAVDRVRRPLDIGCGGLIAHCDWDDGVPFQNIAAFYQRWLEPVLAHA